MKQITITKGGLSVCWYAIHEDSNRQQPSVPIAGAVRNRQFNRLMGVLEGYFDGGEPPTRAIAPGVNEWQLEWTDDATQAVVLDDEGLAMLRAFMEALVRNRLNANKKTRALLDAVDTALEQAIDYLPPKP